MLQLLERAGLDIGGGVGREDREVAAGHVGDADGDQVHAIDVRGGDIDRLVALRDGRREAEVLVAGTGAELVPIHGDVAEVARAGVGRPAVPEEGRLGIVGAGEPAVARVGRGLIHDAIAAIRDGHVRLRVGDGADDGAVGLDVVAEGRQVRVHVERHVVRQVGREAPTVRIQQPELAAAHGVVALEGQRHLGTPAAGIRDVPDLGRRAAVRQVDLRIGNLAEALADRAERLDLLHGRDDQVAAPRRDLLEGDADRADRGRNQLDEAQLEAGQDPIDRDAVGGVVDRRDEAVPALGDTGGITTDTTLAVGGIGRDRAVVGDVHLAAVLIVADGQDRELRQDRGRRGRERSAHDGREREAVGRRLIGRAASGGEGSGNEGKHQTEALESVHLDILFLGSVFSEESLGSTRTQRNRPTWRYSILFSISYEEIRWNIPSI